jgi:hypothetical protein
MAADAIPAAGVVLAALAGRLRRRSVSIDASALALPQLLPRTAAAA